MPRRLPFAVVAAALLLAACGDAPPAPAGVPEVRIALAPRFQVGTTGSAPVTRIRVVAYDYRFDGEVAVLEPIDTTDVRVNPDALEWRVAIDFPPPADTIDVLLEIELLSGSGPNATVEWSGRTEPVPVAGRRAVTVEGPGLGRGPLSNLGVFSLDLFLSRNPLIEGDSTFSTASIASDDEPTVEFYASLDTAVATVDATGKVKTKRDGEARIVLAAGFLADTARLTVLQRAATVDIVQDSITIPVGGTATFTYVARDPRGATISPQLQGGQVAWSIANGQIVRDLGNGSYFGTVPGRTTVTARSQQDQTVLGTAVLRVEGQPASQ